MRMRLMLLGGGNALGQALIRLGAEEDIGFLAPRPPQDGWDAASLTQLLDDTRPDALINLAYYFDWFQAEVVSEEQRLVVGRSVPSNGWPNCASTTTSFSCNRRVIACSTARAPLPTAKKTRPYRWVCAGRRCGGSNKVCAPRARNTFCYDLAGCSMTVLMARSGASSRGQETPDESAAAGRRPPGQPRHRSTMRPV